MPHIHWVARQNKLEIPRDEAEVNKWGIHESDGRSHDPDTMVAPLTPKSTRKAEALARAPPTIASRREEDAALKEVAMLPRYRCASCILETKTTVWSQEKPMWNNRFFFFQFLRKPLTCFFLRNLSLVHNTFWPGVLGGGICCGGSQRRLNVGRDGKNIRKLHLYIKIFCMEHCGECVSLSRDESTLRGGAETDDSIGLL